MASYPTAALTRKTFDLALANNLAGLFVYASNGTLNTVSDFVVSSGVLTLESPAGGLSAPAAWSAMRPEVALRRQQSDRTDLRLPDRHAGFAYVDWRVQHRESRESEQRTTLPGDHAIDARRAPAGDVTRPAAALPVDRSISGVRG
jgi:hypothetical protein